MSVVLAESVIFCEGNDAHPFTIMAEQVYKLFIPNTLYLRKQCAPRTHATPNRGP